MKIRLVPIGRVAPYPGNPRAISAEAVNKVANSLREFGWQQPIVVDPEMVVVAGHTRLLAARLLGMTQVPIKVAEGLTPAKIAAYRLADNRSGEEAEWDMRLLRIELDALEAADLNLGVMTGFDDDELESIRLGDDDDEPGDPTKLADRFGLPPFSVLNARDGWWQDRKRAWIALGIQSELGRGEDLLGRAGELERGDREGWPPGERDAGRRRHAGG